MSRTWSLPVAFILTLGLGAALGAAFGELGAGLSLGAAAFVAFAVASQRRKDKG